MAQENASSALTSEERQEMLAIHNQYSGQISGSQSPVLKEAGVVRMGFNQS
jgi:hypothetical protein